MEKFDPIDIFFIAIISGYFITLACFILSLIYTIIRNYFRRKRNNIVNTKSAKPAKTSKRLSTVGVSTNPIYPKQFANFFLNRKAKHIKVKPVLKMKKRDLAKFKIQKPSNSFKLSNINVIQKLFMTPKVKPLKIDKVKTLEPITLEKSSEIKDIKIEQLNLFSELEIKSIEVPKKNSTPKKKKVENKQETKELPKTQPKKTKQDNKSATKPSPKKKTSNNSTNNSKNKATSSKKTENKKTNPTTPKNKNQNSKKINNSKPKKQNKSKKSSKNKKKNKPKTNKK